MSFIDVTENPFPSPPHFPLQPLFCLLSVGKDLNIIILKYSETNGKTVNMLKVNKEITLFQ